MAMDAAAAVDAQERGALVDATRVDAASLAVGGSASRREEKPLRKKRVSFVGAEYIEYDLDAAPVVRRCGVRGVATAKRTASDVALEWSARRDSDEAASVSQTDVWMASDTEEKPAAVETSDEASDALRLQLESEYETEMREAIAARGFPLLDERDVAVRVQFKVSELLVAWSLVATAMETDVVGDEQASLDAKCKRLELCRKQVFGPVVDGYAFGRRFFSIDSFLSMLELEELVALAESHAIAVPALPTEVVASIKVADRELISTYSPTGLGKPLKMLTFRELVEEAYARGILMDDVRDAKQKKSKRAWVDALRPALHAEMRAFKIREAHAELIHEHLAIALESKMRGARMETVASLVKSYLEAHETDGSSLAEEEQAMHRYFRALLTWYDAQEASSHSTPPIAMDTKTDDDAAVALPPAAAPA